MKFSPHLQANVAVWDMVCLLASLAFGSVTFGHYNHVVILNDCLQTAAAGLQQRCNEHGLLQGTCLMNT